MFLFNKLLSLGGYLFLRFIWNQFIAHFELLFSLRHRCFKHLRLQCLLDVVEDRPVRRFLFKAITKNIFPGIWAVRPLLTYF